MFSKIIKWLAAVGAVGALAGLKALAAQVGLPVDGLDPLVQVAIATAVIKLVNWLVGKLPVQA